MFYKIVAFGGSDSGVFTSEENAFKRLRSRLFDDRERASDLRLVRFETRTAAGRASIGDYPAHGGVCIAQG